MHAWEIAWLSQATVVAVLGLLATWACRRRPAWSVAVGNGTLLALVAIPLATLWAPTWTVTLPARTVAAEPIPLPAKSPTVAIVPTIAELPHAPIASSSVTFAPPAVTAPTDIWPVVGWTLRALYAVVAVALFLRLLNGVFVVRRLANSATPVADADWLERLRDWSQRLRAPAVELRCAPTLGAPVSCGWRRPVILLPNGYELCRARERDAVLVHELGHHAQRDPWWLLLQRLVECVYWFHPCVWLLGRRLAGARERACDQTAAASLGIDNYRASLIAVAARANRRPRLSLGLAMAEPRKLDRRLAWLEGVSDCRATHFGGLLRRAVPFATAAAVLALASVRFVEAEPPKKSEPFAASPTAPQKAYDDESMLPIVSQGNRNVQLARARALYDRNQQRYLAVRKGRAIEVAMRRLGESWRLQAMTIYLGCVEAELPYVRDQETVDAIYLSALQMASRAVELGIKRDPNESTSAAVVRLLTAEPNVDPQCAPTKFLAELRAPLPSDRRWHGEPEFWKSLFADFYTGIEQKTHHEIWKRRAEAEPRRAWLFNLMYQASRRAVRDGKPSALPRRPPEDPYLPDPERLLRLLSELQSEVLADAVTDETPWEWYALAQSLERHDRPRAKRSKPVEYVKPLHELIATAKSSKHAVHAAALERNLPKLLYATRYDQFLQLKGVSFEERSRFFMDREIAIVLKEASLWDALYQLTERGTVPVWAGPKTLAMKLPPISLSKTAPWKTLLAEVVTQAGLRVSEHRHVMIVGTDQEVAEGVAAVHRGFAAIDRSDGERRRILMQPLPASFESSPLPTVVQFLVTACNIGDLLEINSQTPKRTCFLHAMPFAVVLERILAPDHEWTMRGKTLVVYPRERAGEYREFWGNLDRELADWRKKADAGDRFAARIVHPYQTAGSTAPGTMKSVKRFPGPPGEFEIEFGRREIEEEALPPYEFADVTYLEIVKSIAFRNRHTAEVREGKIVIK